MERVKRLSICTSSEYRADLRTKRGIEYFGLEPGAAVQSGPERVASIGYADR